MKQWIANLSIAESVYTEIDKSIGLITRCVAEIETKMAEVNSGMNLNEVNLTQCYLLQLFLITSGLSYQAGKAN